MKRFFVCLFFILFCGKLIAQQSNVDFIRANGYLGFVPDSTKVFGKVWYDFKVLKSIDTVYLDGKNMKVSNVFISKGRNNAKKVECINDGERLKFVFDFKESNDYSIGFDYVAQPKKALYFLKRKGNWQIWTQGQGKYTSNWLPSIDDVNDKMIFNFGILDCESNVFLANGVQTLSVPLQDNCVKHHYDMQKPMSSYLAALVIGKYDKKTEFSKSGIPLEYYYYPEDSLKVEPTYRYTKQMFDFLEEDIGVSFPWQNYKQVPVKDFLYSGMENTSLTIFSDGYVVDSIGFNDRNYITVNAHELAHQWFGNLVTATSGEHHWLQEGFATYYAMLAERHIFGENHYYWQLFQYAQELIAQEESGLSTSLLDPKSSSTTFYKKGAWVLHILKESVGNGVFKTAVKNYVNKHQFQTVETSDFITEVEQVSGQDLSNFVNDWLVAKALPEEAMVESLKRSFFIDEYMNVNCSSNKLKCITALSSDISNKAKIKIISQIPYQIDNNAFDNSLEVRQAIAQYVDKIPEELKRHYETLLNDKSYVTVESALYHLWLNFPEERIKYLQKTKKIYGFNDYNVRLLWLVLHLNTIEFEPEKKQDIFDELLSYCLPDHSFELRQNAFSYLKLIDGFEKQSIESLIDASKHHNWRFSKYAKNLLAELKENPKYKLIIERLKEE